MDIQKRLKYLGYNAEGVDELVERLSDVKAIQDAILDEFDDDMWLHGSVLNLEDDDHRIDDFLIEYMSVNYDIERDIEKLRQAEYHRAILEEMLNNFVNGRKHEAFYAKFLNENYEIVVTVELEAK